MKRLLLLIALSKFTFSPLFAQKTATWQGGSLGQATKWECPKNWKEGRVPDEMSDVVVPDCSTAARPQPVISTEMEPINSLRVESRAALAIEKTGVLIVFEGIEIFGAGAISNEGILAEPRLEKFSDPHAKRSSVAQKIGEIKFELAQVEAVSAQKN